MIVNWILHSNEEDFMRLVQHCGLADPRCADLATAAGAGLVSEAMRSCQNSSTFPGILQVWVNYMSYMIVNVNTGLINPIGSLFGGVPFQ